MILLDTHTWVWWTCRRLDLLPSSLDALLLNTEETVAVASVSCLEVALLIKKAKLRLSRDIRSWFDLAIEGSGLVLVPLTPAIAARSAELPDIHRDPIDRVLIATAIEHDAVLLTKDETITAYPGIRTLWR